MSHAINNYMSLMKNLMNETVNTVQESLYSVISYQSIGLELRVAESSSEVYGIFVLSSRGLL